MKKLMIAAAAASMLAASSFAAFAADVTGAITAIDVTAGTVTLDNGQTYQIDLNQASKDPSTSVPAQLASFKTGDQVTITFDEVNGKLMASALAPAKS